MREVLIQDSPEEINLSSSDSFGIGKPHKSFFSPLLPEQNSDSLWATLQDSVIRLHFPEAGKLKDFFFFPEQKNVSPIYEKGEFKEHLLKPVSNTPRLILKSNQDFSTIVVFALLFIFGVLSMVYRRRVQILFSAFFMRRFANQIQREENALSQRVSVLLSITFIVSTTLLLQRICEIYKFALPGDLPVLSFLILLGVVIVYYISKIIMHRLAGFILKLEREINEYLFNFFLVHQIGGLALFLIALVSSYIRIDHPIWIGQATLSVLGIMFIFQTIRGIGSVRFEGFHTFFYIFLYFCILEVVPLAVIIKWLMT